MNTIERKADNFGLQVNTILETDTGHEYYELLDTLSGKIVAMDGDDLEWLLPTLKEHKEWVRNMKDVYEL